VRRKDVEAEIHLKPRLCWTDLAIYSGGCPGRIYRTRAAAARWHGLSG
jgi:hypothetical protein